MSIFPAIPNVGTVASLLLLTALPAAAQTPDSTVSRPRGTLIKLGTGLTNGFELGGYRGLSVPLVLGVEHHLTSRTSLFANGFSGFRMGRGRYTFYNDYPESIISNYGFDAGVRHYYNQQKRRQKGRATGPFVGNYLALQTTWTFNPNYYQEYRYSTLTAIWGMQRRIGKYGWFDAYVGAGLGREPVYYYGVNRPGVVRVGSRYGFAPELGVKFSLGSRLTH